MTIEKPIIELLISLDNVPLDKQSCAVMVYNTTNGNNLIGKTEVIKNQSSLTFAEVIGFEYNIMSTQTLMFTLVYAIIEKVIDKIQVPVAIFLQRPIAHRFQLVDNVQLTLFPQIKLPKTHLYLEIQPKFTKKKIFGALKAIMKIHIKKELVYVTEPQSNVWEFSIPIAGYSDDSTVLIECFDKDSLIGQSEMSLKDFKTRNEFDVIHPKKTKKITYKNSGILEITSKILHENKFFEICQKQITTVFAIDFSKLKNYEKIIQQISNALSFFDQTQLIPAYCFGIEDKDYCNLNLSSNPFVHKNDLIETYRNALKCIKPGVANLSPLLNNILNLVSSSVDSIYFYFVFVLQNKEEQIIPTDLPVRFFFVDFELNFIP